MSVLFNLLLGFLFLNLGTSKSNHYSDYKSIYYIKALKYVYQLTYYMKICRCRVSEMQLYSII